MDPQQVAERIEDIFSGQLEGGVLLEALRRLQIDLIGEEGLRAIQARRLEEWRKRPPSRNQFVPTQALSKRMLRMLRK